MNTTYEMDWEAIDELIDSTPEGWKHDDYSFEVFNTDPSLSQCTIKPIVPAGYLEPGSHREDYRQQLAETLLGIGH